MEQLHPDPHGNNWKKGRTDAVVVQGRQLTGQAVAAMVSSCSSLLLSVGVRRGGKVWGWVVGEMTDSSKVRLWSAVVTCR